MAGTPPQSKKTHYVVVRKAKDSIRRTGTDGKETRPSGSPSWSMSGQMLGEILGPNCKNRHLPYCAALTQRKILYLRSVNEDKQAPPLPQRPGYQDAKKALVDVQKQVRQECGIPSIQEVERQRLHNQLDPSMQRYLERLSTDWAEYFAEERPPPTYSSSWTPSSSWWTSSSSTSDWHQHEWKHIFEHQVESCRHHHLTAVLTIILCYRLQQLRTCRQYT